MKKYILPILIVSLLSTSASAAVPAADPQESISVLAPGDTVFDDKTLLDGYAKKYSEESKEILLEMIKDNTLSPYRTAAAVRVFRQKYSQEIFAREKAIYEKFLLRRLDRTNSAFVQVEIMHTLCLMDRYRYFNSMVPVLIQKMDHYNSAVNELAYESINDIIESGHNRTREARIVFNSLRKILFLQRKRLAGVKEPGTRLQQKIEILRWAVKILGNDELRKLPKEVIGFL